MASTSKFSGYQGEINDSNKHLFTEGIREAFEFVQTNPDFASLSEKDLAAMRQYDRCISQNVLDELFRTGTDVSLKEVLSAVLASLPEERSNDYVREHIQWVITRFESTNRAGNAMVKASR
jgi:hypothetical protein